MSRNGSPRPRLRACCRSSGRRGVEAVEPAGLLALPGAPPRCGNSTLPTAGAEGLGLPPPPPLVPAAAVAVRMCRSMNSTSD